jgi:hypothetical protein
MALSPPILHLDVSALDVARVTQTLVKGHQIFLCLFQRCEMEKPDHRFRRQLRVRAEWRRCRTTDERDEVPRLIRSPRRKRDARRDAAANGRRFTSPQKATMHLASSWA